MANPEHPVDIQAVGAMFAIPGEFVAGEHYGTGHINDTFAVTYSHRGRVTVTSCSGSTTISSRMPRR